MSIQIGMRVYVRQGGWRGVTGVVHTLERDEATILLPDGGSCHTKQDYLEIREKCEVCTTEHNVEGRDTGQILCSGCWDGVLKAIP